MRIIKNLSCLMRDGVALATDLYLPDEACACPLILMRTPYGREGIVKDPLYGWFPVLVADGYAVASQDMRGTGSSEGEIGLNGQNEFEDGFDAVTFLAKQSFCNGKVGMFGLSYPGFVQTAAAADAPEALKAICPFMSPSLHPFGIRQPHVLHMQHLYWAYAQLLANPEHYLPDPAMREKVLPMLQENMTSLDDLLLKLPLNRCPAAMIPGVPMLKDYLDVVNGAEDPAYWAKMHMPIDYDRVHVPALYGTGWNDGALEWTIEGYRAARKSADPLTRNQAALIIGPWTHGGELPGQLEDVDFGTSSENFREDVQGVMHRWFNQWLKGSNVQAMADRVRYFVPGINTWRTAEDWPPKSEPLTLYLAENGCLTGKVPERPGEVCYLADPATPTPSGIIDAAGRSIIPDWSCVSQRPDVALFVSSQLMKPLEIAGIASMHLKAVTDVRDTDFVCRVLDIDQNGRQTALAAGLIRGSHRHKGLHEPIHPGEITTYDWEVGSLAMFVDAGHRIGVQICSYQYPLCNRNLNTGEGIASSTTWQVAHHHLILGGNAASCVILPVTQRQNF